MLSQSRETRRDSDKDYNAAAHMFITSGHWDKFIIKMAPGYYKEIKED